MPCSFFPAGYKTQFDAFANSLALVSKNKKNEDEMILNSINKANAIENYSFYENFNSETKATKWSSFLRMECSNSSDFTSKHTYKFYFFSLK